MRMFPHPVKEPGGHLICADPAHRHQAAEKDDIGFIGLCWTDGDFAGAHFRPAGENDPCCYDELTYEQTMAVLTATDKASAITAATA